MNRYTNVTHPHYGFLFFVVLMFGLAGLGGWAGTLPSREYPGGTPFLSPLPLLLSGIFVALGLPLLIWIAANRITWNDDGFCSGTIRGKQCAKWSDITDYNKRVRASSQSSENFVDYFVYLNNGKKITFARRWQNHEAFRDAVQERAVHARVQRWEEEGLRAIDTAPQTFTYNVRGARAGIILFPLVVCLAVAPILVPAVPNIIRIFQEEGWQWGLGTAFMITIGFLPAPVAITLMSTAAFADTLRRGEESITVSQQGIRYTDGQGIWEAPWSAVADYGIESQKGKMHYLYTVHLKNRDQPIRFTAHILNHEQLKKYIAHYAPLPSGGKPWHRLSSDGNALGGSVAPFIPGSTGKRVYHYRTRTNRAILLMYTIIVALLPLAQLLRSWMDTGVAHVDNSILSIFGVFEIVLSYGWWLFFAAAIITDEHGITYCTALRRHHLGWSEINRWRVHKQGADRTLILEGSYNRRIRALLLIADSGILQDEIQQRTGQPPVEE